MTGQDEEICNNIYNCDHCNSIIFLNKMRSFTLSNSFHIIKDDNNPIMSVDYNNREYGSNLYMVVFGYDGIVVILTYSQIQNISGLNLWINYDDSVKYPMFKLNIYDIHTNGIIKSQTPNIIVCSLPLESLIYNKTIYDKNNEDNVIEVINVNLRHMFKSI